MQRELPLIYQYFASSLKPIEREQASNLAFQSRFPSTSMFETRLARLEHLGLTGLIVQKMQTFNDPVLQEQDLMQTWARIRTLSQLVREGFTQIRVDPDAYDFFAERKGQSYTIKVTHLHETFTNAAHDNPPQVPEPGSTEPVSYMYGRPKSPVQTLFESVINANIQALNNNITQGRNLMVVVTNDEALQDRLVRHLACRTIKQLLTQYTDRQTTELLWLLDLGDGAYFVPRARHIDCLAGWHDEFADPEYGSLEVSRYLLDLSHDTP